MSFKDNTNIETILAGQATILFQELGVNKISDNNTVKVDAITAPDVKKVQINDLFDPEPFAFDDHRLVFIENINQGEIASFTKQALDINNYIYGGIRGVSASKYKALPLAKAGSFALPWAVNDTLRVNGYIIHPSFGMQTAKPNGDVVVERSNEEIDIENNEDGNANKILRKFKTTVKCSIPLGQLPLEQLKILFPDLLIVKDGESTPKWSEINISLQSLKITGTQVLLIPVSEMANALSDGEQDGNNCVYLPNVKWNTAKTVTYGDNQIDLEINGTANIWAPLSTNMIESPLFMQYPWA